MTFTLANYPWILDTQSKSDILFLDSRDKMKGEIDKELMRNLLQNIYNPNLNADFAYLNIDIERNSIIQDTLNSLVREDVNFRKPLKVKFIGEPGIDEGGVKKEFF